MLRVDRHHATHCGVTFEQSVGVHESPESGASADLPRPQVSNCKLLLRRKQLT